MAVIRPEPAGPRPTRPPQLSCQNCGRPTSGSSYALRLAEEWRYWCPACATAAQEREREPNEPLCMWLPGRPAEQPCEVCRGTTDGKAFWTRNWPVATPGAPRRTTWQFWCPACVPSRAVRPRRNGTYAGLRRMTGNAPWGAMSPEEWVARNGHTLLLGGALADHYEDPGIKAWCGQVLAILYDLPFRSAVQEQYLSPEECAAARAYDPC